MDSIAFIVNPERSDARFHASRIEETFRRNGTRIFYPQRGEAQDRCSMVISFGGDGTLLMGAREAMRYDCPLLGINLGNVGFLTEGEPDQMDRIIRRVLDGDYKLEDRRLLRVHVQGEKESYSALNDAVVTRGGFARLIRVETGVNGEHWGTFTADGMIAATPTGSTGYSLSAGGPIIAPGVDCIVITPVCAHSLQHCPCIVPMDADVEFRLSMDREQRAELQIDGQNVRMLHAGDCVQIKGADEVLRLVRMEDYRFFNVLKTKLDEWSRYREADRR